VLKKNGIFIFSLMVVVTILVASHTSFDVVALLGVVLVIFMFPAFRENIVKDKFRKFKAAIYTSICFTIGLFIFYFVVSLFRGDAYMVEGDYFLSVVVVFLLSLLGNFVYGLPVSLVAEVISMKVLRNRRWVSGLIHIGFGAVTYYIYPAFSLPAVCCSVIFFLWDERMRMDDGS
jgi:Na+/melibiose symporter-like transporter